MAISKVGIYFHPRHAAARALAEQIGRRLAQDVEQVWMGSAWDDSITEEQIRGTDLLICVGGDGTVLRGARSVVPHPVPILGINMGKLGFLTELGPQEALNRLPDIVHRAGRVELRAMIQAEVVPPNGSTAAPEGPYHALNDVVVSRAQVGRPVYVGVSIDGTSLAVYRADGVIVSTATGSTAYALSAGGPVLHPESRDMVLVPIAPHLSMSSPMVLPKDSVVELRVTTDHPTIISVDGQVNEPLEDGATVRIQASPHVARFVKLHPADSFYATLAQRLDLMAKGTE
ncbi:MAG TPA: NAD(+)/NADH kinase [Dehalococcoidia bacterium]